MRRNEIELIAALVEGRLEDETEARALVESSATHRAEYEAQKLAFENLASLPPAELTEHERAALRRDVWTELQARPAAPRAKSPWYLRWSYAAVGLFVIVGLFVVIDRTNPDFAPTRFMRASDDQAAETAALEGAESEAPSPALDAPSAATTEAAGEIAEEAADGSALLAPPDLASLSLYADRARTGTLESADLGATSFDPEILADMTACLEEAGLIDHEVIADIAAENHYIVAVPAEIPVDESTPVTFVDANVCEVVFTDG